jgi:hypothetical protein
VARAFEEAQKLDVFGETLASTLIGLDQQSKPIRNSFEKVVDISAAMFGAVETFNREATFVAAFNLEKQKQLEAGRDMSDPEVFDKSVREAVRLTLQAHYDYEKANRSKWFSNPTVSVSTQFLQYSTNMAFRLTKDFTAMVGMGDLTKGERVEAAKRLMIFNAHIFLTAGFRGTMLYSLFKLVADIIDWDDDEDMPDTDADQLLENTTHDWVTRGLDRFGIDTQYADGITKGVMRGIPEASLGIAMSDRLSVDAPKLFFMDYEKAEEVNWLNMANDAEPWKVLGSKVVGPAISNGLQVLNGVNRLREGHTQRGLEKIMPIRAVTNAMKAHRYATEGAQTLRGQVEGYKAPEEFNPANLWWQAFGFGDADLHDRYRQNQVDYLQEQFLTKRKQELIARAATDWIQNEGRESEATMYAILRFKERWPDQGMDLEASLQRRYETLLLSERGRKINPRTPITNQQMQEIQEKSLARPQ